MPPSAIAGPRPKPRTPGELGLGTGLGLQQWQGAQARRLVHRAGLLHLHGNSGGRADAAREHRRGMRVVEKAYRVWRPHRACTRRFQDGMGCPIRRDHARRVRHLLLLPTAYTNRRRTAWQRSTAAGRMCKRWRQCKSVQIGLGRADAWSLVAGGRPTWHLQRKAQAAGAQTIDELPRPTTTSWANSVSATRTAPTCKTMRPLLSAPRPHAHAGKGNKKQRDKQAQAMGAMDTEGGGGGEWTTAPASAAAADDFIGGPCLAHRCLMRG